MTRSLRTDPAVWFFGLAAGLTLAVSIPATFALLRPFHDAGGLIGSGLAVFAMLVFEIGAVGAKLITLAVPTWRGRLLILTIVLLALTTAGNYLHGAELFRAAELPPTLAKLRTDGYGGLLSAGAAALFPTLLFIWLQALVSRIEMIAHLDQREQRLTQLEHELSRREQDVSRRVAALTADEQALIDRALALDSRERHLITNEQERVITIREEVIRIATAELTWPQFEQVARLILSKQTASLSSLRRLVTEAKDSRYGREE